MPMNNSATRYLDLTKPPTDLTDTDEAQRDRLITAFRTKQRIIVVAGAGISTSARIPAFRSSKDLFAPDDKQHKPMTFGKHLFDAAVYKTDAGTEEFHTMICDLAALTAKAEPTPFHLLLASLAQEGRLLRLYSQNIDCIDTKMEPLATKIPLNSNGPWPTTIQLHGSLGSMVCTKCFHVETLDAARFNGPQAPPCKTCEHNEAERKEAGKRSHGIGRLRPRFVLYNEYNPDEDAIDNVWKSDLKSRPDAVIVVGTSLKVRGAKELVKELCEAVMGRGDGFTAWINIESEPNCGKFKHCWRMVVKAECDTVAKMVDLAPWNPDIGDDYMISPEEDLENQRRWRSMNTRMEVQIPVRQHTSLAHSPDLLPKY